MKRTLPTLGLAILATLPVAALAASLGLQSVMHDWRTDSRQVRAMLQGHVPYSSATVRRVLEGYAADAGRIGAAITDQRRSAQDFRRRFLTFAADSQAALADADQPHAARASFSRLLGECGSCHDAYNN